MGTVFPVMVGFESTKALVPRAEGLERLYNLHTGMSKSGWEEPRASRSLGKGRVSICYSLHEFPYGHPTKGE